MLLLCDDFCFVGEPAAPRLRDFIAGETCGVEPADTAADTSDTGTLTSDVSRPVSVYELEGECGVDIGRGRSWRARKAEGGTAEVSLELGAGPDDRDEDEEGWRGGKLLASVASDDSSD